MLSFFLSISSHEETPQIYVNRFWSTISYDLHRNWQAHTCGGRISRGVVATRCWLVDMTYRKYQAHFKNTNLTPKCSIGLEKLLTFKALNVAIFHRTHVGKSIHGASVKLLSVYASVRKVPHNLAEKQKPPVPWRPKKNIARALLVATTSL